MFSKLFWKDALERAVSTAAQAALSVWALAETEWFDNWSEIDSDLQTLGSAALVAGVLSVLKSLVAMHRAGTISPASAVKPPEE